MMVKISQEQDNQLKVHDLEGKLLETFHLKDNLPRALQLLRQLNSIQTIDGIPVYQTRMSNGVSVWSLYQSEAFWNHLVPYVRYEEALRFLMDKKIERVTIDNNAGELTKYLRINGIEVIGNSAQTSAALSSILSQINRVIGLMYTLMACLKLLIRRQALLIYTPDKFSPNHGCDFRFYPVYEYVRERGIHYIEAFHTLLGREFLGNITQRRRLALYLECLPVFPAKSGNIGNDYDLSPIDSHNSKFFRYLLKVIDQSSQTSIKRIRILARLLKYAEVKALLAIDDVRSITNELIVACQLNGIKAYGFQHGHYTKYHVGWINYDIPRALSVAFDKLFVWNEYWKRVLLSYCTKYDKSNVEISGALRELEPISYKKEEAKPERLSDLSILVPYETFAPKAEVGDYIDRFIEQGIQVSFKVRPDLPHESQLVQYNIKHTDKVRSVEYVDEDLLSRIDAVAGTCSTFLNEMLFYEKPVLLLETSFDLGHQLVDDGLALVINQDSDASLLLNYINNYTSKKAQAWPPTDIKLRETLRKIMSDKPVVF